MSFIEHLNRMRDFNEADLKAVQADKALPMLERRAAQQLLSDDDNTLDRICDRTVGKPKQVVEATVTAAPDPAALLDQARDAGGVKAGTTEQSEATP